MSTNEFSPLVVIRQKEIELAEGIAAEQRAAERAILDAQRQAAEVRAQAEREGRAQAAATARAELAAVSAEVERIASEGERAAMETRHCGARRLDAAVESILQIVLAR